jgi:hypothetical protein
MLAAIVRLFLPISISTSRSQEKEEDGFREKKEEKTGLKREKRMRADKSYGTVDFETFSKILNRPGGFRDPGEPEEYCRGFQVFDKDMTGFIGVGQLRYILTNLGEKMSDEEVDELLKAVDTSSGEINYTGMFSCPSCLAW